MQPLLKPGMRVLVPFGRNKNYVGIVDHLHNNKPEGYTVKPIMQLMDQQPILLDAQLKLWHWIAEYYMSPIGDVMKAALPAGLKAEEGYHPRTETYIRLTPPYQNETTLHVALNLLARAPKQQQAFIAYLQLSGWDMVSSDEQRVNPVTREELMNQSGATLPTLNLLVKRGMLETYEVEVSRLNKNGAPHPELIKKMSEAQQEAYNQILFSFLTSSLPSSQGGSKKGGRNVTLLHGVTSSGKTEIYIHLIQHEIDQHRQVLYLLPEIALTVQMMERLQRVFGNRLGIYHSKYSDAERVEIWQKQLSSHPYDVILGARSAVFLPFQRLGLVIVDEEHETSFKQQDPAPRYHARSVAIMLATAPSNLPQLGEAAAREVQQQKIIDHYKTAGPSSYKLLKDFSIENRNKQTEAEKAMWELLRHKNFNVKFRRQHVIGDFIVDFACLSKNLIIEIDGGYHLSPEQKEADSLRTAMLKEMGFTELRFTNEQVLFSPDEVVNKVTRTLSAAVASPSWGRLEGAVLLGTATPSLETYHNATTGKYGLVELKQRYQDIEMPEIQVVDIQELQRRKMMHGPFSPLLLARVREALESGRQAILFQNRRGWAPMVECRQCGWVPRCEHCDVSLTLHRSMNQLTCHYCGNTYRVPTECPACGSKDLQGKGYGTEKIEDQIRDIFPMARIARMDLDTTRTRQAYERLISDFSAGRTNLLIGTQMVTKGLDFDKVSVVGILNADSMLNIPDFRAYEHAFMMMAQVSGRAGRKGQRGLVILQTKQPDLPLIDYVKRNDYTSFYRSLMAERQAFHYPPYYHIIYIFLKHQKDQLVDTAGLELGARLRQWFGARVLGPDKPAVARVKTLSIRKLVLKLERGIDMAKVREYLRLAQTQMLQDKRYASLQLYYDVDPL
jgi:primosomal protein N'